MQVEKLQAYIFYVNVLVRERPHLGSHKKKKKSVSRSPSQSTEAFYADGGFKRSKTITTQSRDQKRDLDV